MRKLEGFIIDRSTSSIDSLGSPKYFERSITLRLEMMTLPKTYTTYELSQWRLEKERPRPSFARRMLRLRRLSRNLVSAHSSATVAARSAVRTSKYPKVLRTLIGIERLELDHHTYQFSVKTGRIGFRIEAGLRLQVLLQVQVPAQLCEEPHDSSHC